MVIAAESITRPLPPPAVPVWGVPASVAIHSVLAALSLLAIPAPVPTPRAPRSISVEVISQSTFAAMTKRQTAASPLTDPAPAPPLPAATAPQPEPEPEPRTAGASETIRATKLFAADLLAEPASAALRRGMKTLEVSERLVQLCDIEAMAQVRAARPEFDPDIVVAYARQQTEVRDGALVADGAAFRSRREWYGLTFRCEGLPDLSAVTAFSFSVGELIPHELWDAYYLTAEESDE